MLAWGCATRGDEIFLLDTNSYLGGSCYLKWVQMWICKFHVLGRKEVVVSISCHLLYNIDKDSLCSQDLRDMKDAECNR